MRHAARAFLWAVGSLVCAAGAAAQIPLSPAYRLVVPTTAGGPLDSVARTLAGQLARHLNEAVIVENRPGASAMIGTEHVARAPADGKTMLMASGFVVTNAVQFRNAIDVQRELRPVIEISQAGMVLVARKGIDAPGPSALVRAAAAKPGGLDCAAPPGEMGLACEQLKQVLGQSVVAIPYPGVAPAMNALVSGQVDVMFAPYDAVVPHALTGRINPVATGGHQAALAPLDRLPLLRDTWAGFTVIGLLGVFVPNGTPDAMVQRLNAAFNRALQDPQVRDFMLARGSRIEESAPEKLASTIADRTSLYRKLARETGIQPQ